MRIPTNRGALTASLTLALGAAGCATEATTTTEAPKADATYEAGPFDVAPGGRSVMCSFVRGTNAADEDITAFETTQNQGARMIVYTLDHQVDLPPQACPKGGQLGWSRILVSQQAREIVAFPPGIGVHVKAHQQYVIETHYENLGAAVARSNATFGATYGAPGSVKMRAGTYFFGTLNIDLASGQKLHAETSCKPPAAMTMRTMFAHEGRHGTAFGVDLRNARGGDEEVYRTSQWQDPPVRPFPGLELTTGDTVHVACDWENSDAKTFRFPDESCFAVGYSWPAEAPVQCIAGGGDDTCQCITQGVDLGPGGAAVDIEVSRKENVPSVRGDMNQGAPIYCALYRASDWTGALPNQGAWPAYYRDALDATLATEADKIKVSLTDVTPGDYRVSCMMDTIGGGFMLGRGDLVNAKPTSLTIRKGETPKVTVELDGAYP